MNFPIIPIGYLFLALILPLRAMRCEAQTVVSTTRGAPWIAMRFRGWRGETKAQSGGATIQLSGTPFSRPTQIPVLSEALAPLIPPSASQSAELPPSANSSGLRSALLARAVAHLSPKWKNPGVSDRGLDPTIVTALQQQQSYLHSASRFANAARFPAPPSAHGRSTTCQNALVRTVNGKTMGVIFTPSALNNSYRIEGCLFGTIRGRLELEPHPADSALRIPPIALTVDSSSSSWSDNQIEAHLDSRLFGIPDLSVTLLIHLANGRLLELPGCFFVAARGPTTLLQSIPASWISLQPSTIRSHSIERLEYVSPPVHGSGIPADAVTASAFVSRLDADDFGPGADVYDFTQLNPGWVVDSVQLQTYNVPCPGTSISRQSSGHWDTQWNGRRLTIQLQDDVCVSQVSPSFTFHLSVSQYALKVWVVGPVGTKPLADALLHNTNRSLTQSD